MELLTGPFIKSFIAIFLITDVFGNLPFFIGFTEGMSEPERRKVFRTSLLTGFALLLIFIFAGTIVLDLFSLTMSDFKIAGGILLLLIAIDFIMRGKVTVDHQEDVGIVPLGFPLLVGPGAITTSMVLLSMYGYVPVLAAIVACFAVIWLTLFFSRPIYNILGRSGALIITKIMALLIASIAVQLMRSGIMALLK
jgi:multiple antibiotic resistance protein